MSDQTRSYAERVIIYVLLALAAAIWLGFGGAVFVGILHNAGAG